MSLLFMFYYVLSLCLYLCTCASGGLILIARQASKCLRHTVFFFSSDITDCVTICSFAWQLITITLCFTLTSRDKIPFSVKYHFLFHLLTSDVSLFAAGYLALWRGGQAVLQRTCVTCLQRWIPSSQLWPLSTLSTKSCWDHSYTDERAGEFENSGLFGIWGRY